MKKFFYAFAAVLTAATINAQTQRLVLAEEFTQASCPPCAATNPTYNAILDANAGKVVAIKYQTDWPGTDPMNVHNPADVQTRVTYYGVTGVPNGFVDGTGHADMFSGTQITNRYAVPAPYSVNVTHTLNTDFSVLTANVVITKLANVTGTALKAHIAVVEREINFLAAPGTNGEKDFYSVMKKMLPNAGGTDLAAMNIGESITLTQSWTLANVYDKNQLAVIAFVQDNTSKEVHQTGYSAPQAVVADVQAVQIVNLPAVSCAAITADAEIKNKGPQALTACTVRARIDAGAYVDFPWTGNLASGQSTNVPVTLPATTSGEHNLQILVTAANTGDFNTVNDTRIIPLVAPLAATTTAVAQGFTATAIPANFLKNNGLDNKGWARAAVNTGSDAGALKLRWWSIAEGEVDDIYYPTMDLTAAPVANLKFNVAHAPYQTYQDRLQVNVSKDCGATWTSVYNKSSSTLATSPSVTANDFTPTAAQWRWETVSLANFIGAGNENVIIQFRGISAYGNSAYIDHIGLETFVSTINADLDQRVNIFPNPTTGQLSANIALKDAQDMTITITNTLGQEVSRQAYKSTMGGNISLDLTNQAAGSYFVKIATEQGFTTKKVTVQR